MGGCRCRATAATSPSQRAVAAVCWSAARAADRSSARRGHRRAAFQDGAKVGRASATRASAATEAHRCRAASRAEPRAPTACGGRTERRKPVRPASARSAASASTTDMVAQVSSAADCGVAAGCWHSARAAHATRRVVLVECLQRGVGGIGELGGQRYTRPRWGRDIRPGADAPATTTAAQCRSARSRAVAARSSAERRTSSTASSPLPEAARSGADGPPRRGGDRGEPTGAALAVAHVGEGVRIWGHRGAVESRCRAPGRSPPGRRRAPARPRRRWVCRPRRGPCRWLPARPRAAGVAPRSHSRIWRPPPRHGPWLGAAGSRYLPQGRAQML